MKDRTFRIILFTVIILGLLATVLHVIYIADAYEHCSIIQFIAKERW